MGSILLINAAGRETRVALVENGHIAEFYLERKKDKGVVGNIYKGRVVRVLPGMQAAFVDIGLDKAAFLYVSDVVYDPDFARAQFELTEGEHEDAPEVPDDLEEASPAAVAVEPPSLHAEVEHVDAHADALHEAAHAAAFSEGGAPGLDEAEEIGDDEASDADDADEAGAEEPGDSTDAAALDRPASPPETAPGGEPALATAGEAIAAPVSTAGGGMADAPIPLPAPDPAVVPLPAPTDASSAGGENDMAGATSSATSASPPARGQPRDRRTEQGERRAPRELRERQQQERGRDRDRGRNGHGKGDRRDDRPKPRKEVRIEDLLKVGQEVVVQISKDPIGSKGARLTSHISIPGRHLVFMPTVDHVGISRRISNEKERRRLREIVDRLRPPGTGFIVRTVAENVPQAKLESDIRFLIEIWNQVVRKNEKRGGPGLMHPDLDLILRATRDLFAADVEKLVVDEREEYERILGFVTAQDPALAQRVVLHDSDEPIFDSYGIEQEIRRATQRKVWLKSGGYLIIDQAEALTAIDVNSGRYVGKKSLEETITKINMEAAKEIVYQLRLRNIGGIIICDFIDMEKPQNRDKVFKSLQEALGRDKAKTNVLRISELGLVEMTRKRVRESIGRMLHEDCGYCGGQGFVKAATTVAYEIFREVRREAPNFKDPTLVVNCNVEVARLLQSEEREELRHLMDRYNKTIQVRQQTNYHREQYDLYGRSAHGEDHKVASSSSTLRAPEGVGLPMERTEPVARDRDRDRGQRGGRNRRGGRDRDRGERSERGGDRGGRGDRTERGEKGDRGDRGERERREGTPTPPTVGADKAPGV
ncbi:MAG: Rne/Rng family ribonuclease [Myxococcaceae bacterium]|nr:MAG: Rne/Rng family ribonuclease [Myxococcaceae bacterium]